MINENEVDASNLAQHIEKVFSQINLDWDTFEKKPLIGKMKSSDTDFD